MKRNRSGDRAVFRPATGQRCEWDVFWETLVVVEPPLWKIWKSVGMIRNPLYEKKNVRPLQNMSQLRWFETQWNRKNIPNHQLTYRATPQKPGISFRNPKHLGKVRRCLLLGRWDLESRTLIRKDAMNHNVALYRCSVGEKPWLEFTYLEQFRAAPNTQKSRWKKAKWPVSD